MEAARRGKSGIDGHRVPWLPGQVVDHGPRRRVDRAAIAGELERTRVQLHRLLADASDTSLRSRSAGTRWTNEQLLFHMVFGYMVVAALLPWCGWSAGCPPEWSVDSPRSSMPVRGLLTW